MHMSKSLFVFEADSRNEDGYEFTVKELEQVSYEICNALFEEYRDTKKTFRITHGVQLLVALSPVVKKTQFTDDSFLACSTQ